MAVKVKTAASSLDNLSLPGKLAVGLVFVLLVGALYFVLFYGDVESEIGAQENLIEQKKTELQQADADRAVYMKDIEEKTRREALKQKQKKILPDEAESPAFLATVQTVATLSGVNLTSWTPQDEVAEDFYAKVPMRLVLEGRFHQVTKFFHGVGQVDRIINIEDITIKAVPVTNPLLEQQKQAQSGKKDATPPPPVEQQVDVKVECLATAFRALRPGEGVRNRDKGAQGRPGRPPQPGAPPPAPQPAAQPAPAEKGH
jgi:type IV pilus assembly protein PilO